MTNLASRSAAAFVGACVLAGSPSPARAQAGTAGAAAPGSQACVAIVLPSAKGIDGDATAFANSLRDLFVGYLTGPSVRAITLEARLASQAIEEARQKTCGHVLVTSIERKRGGTNGWAGALGQAAGSAAYYGIPYGGGAAVAAARGVAVAGASAISTMAQTTRARDEVTLEFRLGSADSVMRVQPRSEKAKARNDGEDLLTPLVEKISEAVVTTIVRK